ncbi:MAG: hypothetical protein IJ677_00945 [Alphaproteobacteria bacterium]|nr:hypothetical protein [Alphaproteobacteria bacterium]
MRIFISGSIGINKLPASVIKKIDSIIAKNFIVLIGDAKGVDLAVQKYLFKKKYKNVEVYYAGDNIRHNVGDWRTKGVLAKNNEKGRDLYTLKDVEMAKEADYGLMIWDGESKGTLNNIQLMNKLNKKFFVALDGLIVNNVQIEEIIRVKEQETQLELF